MVVGRVRRHALQAASETYRAASEGRELIADLADGFGIKVRGDKNAISGILDIMAGKEADLPFRISIDPTVDNDES